MRNLKFSFLLLLSSLVFFSCVSPPPLVSFFVSDGVIQYFLSPTEWIASGSKAKLDITYRTGVDTPATVNISFYGSATTPRSVSSVLLRGTELECPLEFINIIFPDPEKKELRVSFTADRDKIVDLFETEPITLKAEVDGADYVYVPNQNFYDLKNKFVTAVRIMQ